MLIQTSFGILLASCIALGAVRLHALTRSGAVAAVIVGTLVFVAGGLGWSAILLTFFASSSALSRLHRQHVDTITAKGGPRDAGQVLANGGIPALVALAALLYPGPDWTVPYTGALAASTADTWATEIGRLSRSRPRLITTLRSVPPGSSGGVTLLGLLASAAGAGLLSAAAILSGVSTAGIVAGIAGLAGSVLDSFLGATIQEVRECPVCLTRTEQTAHAVCGTATVVIGGIPGCNNDTVNILASTGAALIATALVAVTRFV